MHDFQPLPPLSQMIAVIDQVMGLERVLKGSRRVSVEKYYHAAEKGYHWVHSREGCMHLALSPRPQFQTEDFRTQVTLVAEIVHQSGARRVLELGSGMGYNLIELARLCPGVELVGIDLVDRHVRKTRARVKRMAQVSVRQASFEDIPQDLGVFDVVFAIETLCYATDRPAVAATVSRALRPGGQLLIFDASRPANFASLAADMRLAVELYEATTAVHGGFAGEQDWTDALARAGMATQRIEDLSNATIPGLRRLYQFGARYFSDPAIRAVTAVLPSPLKKNAVGALLGPYLIEGSFEGDNRCHEPGLRYGLRVATT